MLEEFEEYLKNHNLSANTITSYSFALKQYLKNYNTVTRKNLKQYKLWLAANKISFVSKPLYYYVQSNNTITAKPKKSDYSDIIKNSNELQSLLQQKVTDNLLACYICSSMVYALQLCYRVGNNPIVEKQKICKQIRDLSERFTFSDAMKSNKGLKLILCKLGIIDKVVKIIEENRR